MKQLNKVFSLKLICMLLAGVFLYNTVLYSYPGPRDTLRIPLGTKRLEDIQEETKKDEIQLEKAQDKMKELHLKRFKDLQDKAIAPLLHGASYTVGETELRVGSLAPTQGALQEELLGILRTQRKVYGKDWLRGKPIVVVKIKGKAFIIDGHHRTYVAHENKDDLIRAYVIRVRSGGDVFYDYQIRALEVVCRVRTSPDFVKTWGLKVDILPDALHVWQAVFYNLMYPSLELREKIMETIPFLRNGEETFLQEARRVISEKDPLWDEYVLVEAISKLDLSDSPYREEMIEEAIEISPSVFRKAKENIAHVSESEDSITLSSGIVLREGNKGSNINQPHIKDTLSTVNPNTNI